jgi:hypothetical protein
MNYQIDGAEFASLMRTLYAAYGVDESPPQMRAYFDALCDLSMTNVRRGFSESLRDCKFFPRPADIREHAFARTARGGDAPEPLPYKPSSTGTHQPRVLERIQKLIASGTDTAAAVESVMGPAPEDWRRLLCPLCHDRGIVEVMSDYTIQAVRKQADAPRKCYSTMATACTCAAGKRRANPEGRTPLPVYDSHRHLRRLPEWSHADEVAAVAEFCKPANYETAFDDWNKGVA